VLVPAGQFTFGSATSEAGRDEDEREQRVTISKPMLVGAYEVTQRQYVKVMGKNPSYFSKGGDGSKALKGIENTDDFPVEQVTWDDATEFCRKLPKLASEKAAWRGYRLLTEAEWEYACRAGTKTPFSSGELLSPNEANVDGDRPYLNSPDGPTLKRTTAVGSYKSNAFGLYDMHGNVWEWVADRYAERPMSGLMDNYVDPTGPVNGEQRVVRGGGYLGDVALCRSASRRDRDPDYSNKSTGFRVVCVLSAKLQTQ
jgi:formylglycine-generating enzyme required for sulfatase activity